MGVVQKTKNKIPNPKQLVSRLANGHPKYEQIPIYECIRISLIKNCLTIRIFRKIQLSLVSILATI